MMIKWGGCIFTLLLASCFSFAQTPTFHRDIAPIIYENCSPCHRPGQIAPMPLTTYQEVADYGSMIRYVTGIRYMPPWKAVGSEPHFVGEQKLTQQEIDLIRQWVDDGLAAGEPSEEPPLPAIETSKNMGSPDLVFAMSESFEQYGVYYDQFKVFVLPTNLTADQYISAIEFVPGNSKIVRSCYISVDTSDRVLPLDAFDVSYGYYSFGELGFVPDQSRWFCWQAGDAMTVYPDGTGKRLPKNARLLLHVHYGPTAQPLPDSSFVRMKISHTPLREWNNVPLLHPYNLTNPPPFKVAAGERPIFHASFRAPVDMQLRSLTPHAHLLGREWEIFVREPGQQQARVLLKIDDWDIKWRRQFIFSEQLILKKGSEIHAIAKFDNTAQNHSNPSDPPHGMDWGKRMFEEMFLVYFEWMPAQKNRLILDTPIPSVITDKNFVFPLGELADPSSYEFSLNSFDSVHSSKAIITTAPASATFDLTDLPAGNYLMSVKNSRKEIIYSQSILLAESDLFE